MQDYEIGYMILLIFIVIFAVILAGVCIKNNADRHEFFDAFVKSDIQSNLEDQFQMLFGSRKLQRTYNCSRKLASNFDYDEYRINYLEKYFDFIVNDETIGHLNSIYILLKKLNKLVENNPNWERYKNEVLPTFSMYYESPAGRNWYRSEFEFNTYTVKELAGKVRKILSKQSSKKAQRSKMTKELRVAILRRDNWTCQICGNSKFKEPNLLLEVDHIIPIAKGGKTEPNNLQTLCWKCNRKKSDGFYAPPAEDIEGDTEKIVFPDDSFL